MSKVLTQKDIDAAFTAEVNCFLREGYVFHLDSMKGLQSDDINRVDLSDGKDVIRVRTAWIDRDDTKCEGICIVTSLGKGLAEREDSIWNSEMVPIGRKMFFQLDYHGKAFTSEESEAFWAQKTRRERLVKKAQDRKEKAIELNETGMAIVSRYLKRVLRKKRINAKQVYAYRNASGRVLVLYQGRAIAMS